MRSRFAASLALAILSVSAFAQSPVINGIAHVAYRVSDLDKEVAFLQKLGYQESFGFTDAAGKTTEVFIKINDRQFFEVYPQTDPAQKLGWMHVCYESGDIDALYSMLVAHGLKPTPVRKAGAGNMLTTMNDPEGRTTEFTQYMPGSRHTLDKGLHLGDHRISDQLLGFSLPVPDLDAARKFYTAGLGFDARDGKNGLRLTIPGAPDARIQIRSAAAAATPATLFSVPDAAKALQQLQAAGLEPKQDRNRVLVSDPDGNVLAFVAPRTDEDTPAQ
jgi:catechol 2,3-dioxygenase-like lactoylglutathione lyase family enzyme